MAGVSPEYQTMIACTGELVSNIEANNPGDISIKLRANELLSSDVFKKLDLPIKGNEDKARDIVRNVTDKVFANHKVQFPKFVAVLRTCEGLGDLVQLLEATFAAQNARTQGVEKGGHSSDSAIAAKNVGTQIEGHPPKHGKLMQLNFTKDVLKKMSNNDTVERISAVINLAGLPKSGKTTLISRLLGRKFEHHRPSTGICNTTLAVDLQPAQLYAVELGEDFIWEDFEHYKSLQNQLHDHIPSNVPESDSSPAGVVNDDPADNNVEMNDTVMNLIKGLEIDSFKKLATKGSVYIRDVGGQPEFKQGLSILVLGPSIFLFVFNAFIDIDEEQSMKYRFFDDNKQMQYTGNFYESKMSTKTALLQFLSSVKSIRYTTTGDGKSYEPVVLIVGTHIDLLSEDDRLPRIEQIHDKLKKVIEPKFTDIVLDTVDSKPMFAVNNFVDNDSGLQSLRERVNILLKKRKFPHPIKYVLFALDLMKWDKDVLTFKECEELAQKFGIDNTSSLLKFFHVHVGTLLWFDPQQLSNWVFKNPQFLFNKITDIILKTFVDISLGNITNKAEAQQHGIFKAEELESMLSTKKCGLEPDEFLRFFIHLRMIAEFEDKQNGESMKKYFIPSFLCHGCNDHDDFLLDARIKRISPLSFTFAYGSSPDGLFGVLVCTLWQDQHMEEGEDISFEAVIKEIYKNKVSFKVRIAHDMDTIALVIHSSRLDMQFIPEVSEPKKRSFPVEKSCCMVHEAMKKCISNSLDTLCYDKQKVKHQTSFKCYNKICDQRHAVEGVKGLRIMRCSAKTYHDRFDLKEEELYWFNEATYCAQESKKVERVTDVRVPADSRKIDESTKKSSDDDDDSTVPPAKKHCPGEKGGKLDKPQTAHDKPPAVVAVPIGDSQPSIVMPTVDSQPSPAEIFHKLVHHVGIDISKLTESPDDNKLRDISDHQGAEWESCATKLGLSLGDINDIKTDHNMVKEQRFRALALWKQRQSFMATYKVLVEVFISLKHVDLAKYVCELLK